jgi:hypothetical protein
LADREIKGMAGLTFVKRSTLPAAVKGKAGSLSVAITSNGQIVFSKLATAALNGSKKVVVAFDGATMYVFQSGAKLVAKVAPEDMISLSFAKKGGTASFSGAAILRAARDFGASHVYDFKASGNQTFPPTVDDKNGCVKITLPEKLAARPVTKRAKKVKVATGTVANPAETHGTPVGEQEELVLEPA